MSEVWAIVLNFRTAERTLTCLNSLFEEGVRDVVLVDNSEDGGKSLREIDAGLQVAGEIAERVRTIASSENLGFAAGVNRALSVICETGPADVLLLNSDARLGRGALAALLAALNCDPAVGVVAPLLAGRNGRVECPRRFYRRRLALLSRREGAGRQRYLSGACLLLSRRIVRPALLDEDFFFYGEDVALAADVERLGLAQVVVEDGLAIHEGSGSSRNGSLFYEYHVNLGHWLLAGKLALGRTDFILACMGRMLILPARASLRSLRNRTATPLIAFWMATGDIVRGRFRRLTPPV